jgi:hypothetical protein
MRRSLWCRIVGFLLAGALLVPLPAHAAAPTQDVPAAPAADRGSGATGVPVLAYYYIWFNPSSWNRAKVDYPLLGRYSSDESAVMRQHISMAKSAGIEGFLVSWKDTPTLTPRLERLAQVAREMDFSLGVVYQGLDFARQPLPIEKVRHDLQVFADDFAANPVFDILGAPVVVWTGTRDFSREDIASVVAPVADRVTVLASASSVEDYERVADVVAGNAHYWGAVNPEKTWYPPRMREMGAAVRARGGLWIAPAAPGFDARLVGGSSVVPRDGTQTLAKELAVAASSAPDAIGLISWNEFSENTHVEPSEDYGKAALEEVARFVGGDPQQVMGVDSSGATGGHAGFPGWVALLLTAIGVVAASIYVRRNVDTSGAQGSAEGFGW